MVQLQKQKQTVIVNLVNQPKRRRKKKKTQKPPTMYERATEALEVARMRKWTSSMLNNDARAALLGRGGTKDNPIDLVSPSVKSYSAPPSRFGPADGILHYSPGPRDLSGKKLDFSTTGMTPIRVFNDDAPPRMTPDERARTEERDQELTRIRETLPPRAPYRGASRTDISMAEEEARDAGFRTGLTRQQYSPQHRTRSGLVRETPGRENSANVQGHGELPRTPNPSRVGMVATLASVIEESGAQTPRLASHR